MGFRCDWLVFHVGRDLVRFELAMLVLYTYGLECFCWFGLLLAGHMRLDGEGFCHPFNFVCIDRFG